MKKAIAIINLLIIFNAMIMFAIGIVFLVDSDINTANFCLLLAIFNIVLSIKIKVDL